MTASPTAASAGSASRSAFARWQFWLLLLGVGLLAGLLMQLVATDDAEIHGLGNTDLDGYAAVASVLEDEGVNIHRAYSAEAARELITEHPEAGVVVMMRDVVPEERFVTELEAIHDIGREVLWISGDPQLLEITLGGTAGPSIPVGAAGTAQAIEAGEACEIPAARTAETIQSPGTSWVPESATGQDCFPVSGEDAGEDQATGHVLTQTPQGLVFTAPEAFTNQHIVEEGNAALALGLLAGTDAAAQSGGDGSGELIWYTPSGADAVGSEDWASPLDFLPDWLWPLMGWLLICAVIAMFAAGRRVGPVVTEPMPVSVPAAESAEGRGRLYQQANATAAAAQSIRSAHLLRLARLLRLGRAPHVQTIAEAASRATGRTTKEIAELLQTPAISSNPELVAYAQAMTQLEADVRSAVRMRGEAV